MLSAAISENASNQEPVWMNIDWDFNRNRRCLCVPLIHFVELIDPSIPKENLSRRIKKNSVKSI